MDQLRSLAVIVSLVVAALLPTGFHASAGADQLTGCGEIFAIPSIGVEGQVQTFLASSNQAMVVSIELFNVSSSQSMVPIGKDSGNWQLQVSSGDRKVYDVESSLELTTKQNNNSLSFPPDGLRTLVLVFEIEESADMLIFNNDLGGVLQRDGVPVCSSADDEIDKPSAIQTATTTAVPPTETPRPTATIVPIRIPNTPTAAPRRNIPTSVAQFSAATITTQLRNGTWYPGEFPGLYAPTSQLIDGGLYGPYSCIEAYGSWGSIVYYVFESAQAANAVYQDSTGMSVTLFATGRSAKLYDGGDAHLTIALSGQVMVVGFTQQGTYAEGQFYDRATVSLELADRGIIHLERTI